MKRGDVILVRFPHPSGVRGKKRQAVVVQSDASAATVSTLVVAEVTKNLGAETGTGLVLQEAREIGMLRPHARGKSSCIPVPAPFSTLLAQHHPRSWRE